MKKIIFVAFILVLSFVTSYAQTKKTIIKRKPVVGITTSSSIKEVPGIRVKIITDSGIIIVRLYDSTPNHRDNFVKLVKQGFYDSLSFHRVIPNFMIQGGDPTSKNASPDMILGNGGDSLGTIPAEFRTYLFHKRGAFAAARKGDNVNPAKASNGCQFYIVTGQKFTDDQLNQMELRMNRTFTSEERNTYKTIGGTPWLDQSYTVFGEVESGIEVADKISSVPKDGNDRPLTDIRMKIEIIK